MTTEKERELAEAFRETVLDFRKAHGTSEAALLDILLGTVAGAACRFGEARDAFGARALSAYDTLAPLVMGPTGIYGLFHPEYRAEEAARREARRRSVDVYGDALERFSDGETSADSDQTPVRDALQRHKIAPTAEGERAYIAGRTDEYKETKPRFPIRRQQKAVG